MRSMFFNFKVITLRGTRRGACGDMHLGAQALEANQHTLFRHFINEFFSRNLGQIMPKMHIFLEKRLKNCRSARELRTRTPLAPRGWGLCSQTFASYSYLLKYICRSTFQAWTYFITLKNSTKVKNSKCYAFASPALLCLFFTLNFKNGDKYLALPEIFFVPPGYVGLATALNVIPEQW